MGKRKVTKEEGEHEVNITVTIAKASEIDYDLMTSSLKKKGKSIEAPKAQTYFHCTYKLLPDDKESVKTDVVTYGFAAKLYTESDSRVLRTWVDGGKTWVAWTNSHKIKVTKDVLLKMFNHSLELKIWDSKERVSPRARFDRPKAFKLPQLRADEEFDIENIKKLLRKHGVSQKEAAQITQSINPDKQAEAMEPKDSTHGMKTRTEGMYPNAKSKVRPTSKATDFSTSHHMKVDILQEKPGDRNLGGFEESPDTPTADSNSVLKVKVFLNDNKEPQMGNLMKLASVGIKEEKDDDEELDNVDLVMARKTVSNLGKRSSSTGRSSKSKSAAATDKKAEARAAHIKAHGLTSVSVKLSSFFTGVSLINGRLEFPIGTVEDLVITLSVDQPLLSEPQRKALNPLIIRILSANNMPSQPVSYSHLRKRCLPPYISYSFHDQPLHKSRGCVHASKIEVDDVYVVLLGIQEKEKLFEYLRGPGLQIEVHDRDRDTSQKNDVPTIFGQHEDDNMINKASFVTGRRTDHNPFTQKDKVWDPYGIATFNLSDFLLGEKIIEGFVPIRCCKIPDVIDGRGIGNNSEKVVGTPGSVDGPNEMPMPVANYIEAGSELKAKIELAYPLKTIQDIQLKRTVAEPMECPFSRLVYIFDYQSKDFLQKIQSEVMSINAETLQLKDFPQHVIEAALSTYKLSDAQRISKSLNIITGFQIIDGVHHIFVLEGLRDHGIKTLWENLSQSHSDGSNVLSLYNTDITFQERIYASLDVDLTRVRLHQPLGAIVKLPLLYVRDMIPRLCLEAVLKLYDLLSCPRLRDAIRNDLFPSDAMIASLSREFGIPLTVEDLQAFAITDRPDPLNMEPPSYAGGQRTTIEEKPFKTSRPWTPLQLKNETYESVLKSRTEAKTRKNFLSENISSVQQVEPIKREKTITCDPASLGNLEAHNYSIQSLNTSEMAKRKLRSLLAADPDSRFTYSQEFGGATVLPDNLDDVRKEEVESSRTKWRTADGFVFPGRKTSQESNKHPRHPDGARLDELKKPWRENILHANKLKPTVDRMKFSWEERKCDFDILKKPKEFFDKAPPITIHLAGDTLKGEQKLARKEEQKTWERSLVVDDMFIKMHRCATETELTSKGFKSSSQLARLDDILKSEPRKYALSAPGLRLKKIPALSVVLNPTVDSSLGFYERLKLDTDKQAGDERNSGYHPGPFDSRSWLLDKNKIPVSDYNHSYFENIKGADFR
eukprot:gene2461-18118_t